MQMISQELDLYYWVELYPWKENGAPFIFEICNEKYREEFYISKDNPSQYELYVINSENEMIKMVKISRFDFLKIIRENKPDFWSKNINVSQSKLPEPKYNGYLKHRLYVASDYETIIKTLISTLSNLGYYYYSSKSENELQQFNQKDFLNKTMLEDPQFSVISFMFRTEYNEGYPGCLITVENTQDKLCNLIDLNEPIFDWVFEKIEDIPCVVEFDFNINLHFSSGTATMDTYVTPFYKELYNKKIKSILFSIDNEAFIIKTNPFINDNNRLAQFDIYSKKNIDPKYNETIIKEAENTLGLYWNKLSHISQRAFPVGLDYYETYKLYKGDILDASPSAIQFSKCLEIEIEQKLLLPFRAYFLGSAFKSEDFSNDITDKDISKVSLFLTKPELKAPELGTFAYFLSIVINSKARGKISPTIRCFKEFVNQFKNKEFILSSDFQKSIEQITTKYRNGSAHTKALPFDLLEEFYSILIGQNLDGLLIILLDSLEVKIDETN